MDDIGRRAILASAAAIAAGGMARAQSAWPAKPIRIVVPFAPGGAIDALVRVIADGLTSRLGQQILVDPKPGANTIVGADIVAKAAPDGYTFLITTNSTHTNNPTLYAKLPFDPDKDLIPVSLVSLGTILLVVKADAPFNDLRSMAAWVKGLGRPATYGSWGIGSSGHLYGLMFEKALGGQNGGALYNHVPYRGTAPALNDLVAGHVDLFFDNISSSLPQHLGGNMKILAVAQKERASQLPDVPTVSEAGLPGFSAIAWFAVVAPEGTPDDIIAKINKDIVAALNNPEVRRKYLEQAATPVANSPAEALTFIQNETKLWGEVIRVANVKLAN